MCLLFLLSACHHKIVIKELKLIRAYEVQTENKYEPSGLTLWDNQFYSVSDKHNDIFRLQFNRGSVELVPIIHIQGDEGVYLDFEGITHDDKYFYLISENKAQIMKVSKDGTQQLWLPANDALKKISEKAGLLQKQNAYFEGLCHLSKGQFLLAAERDPRGFVEITVNHDHLETVNAYQSNESIYPSTFNRSADFAGLSCEKGRYVLERNAYIVSSLKKHQGKYQERYAWSFQKIIEYPNFLYQDMQYGHAEGLVVKGDKIYIILDNNKNPHQNNSKNNNSLFLELQM